MREFRQTSVRFTSGRLLFFVAAWLVVLLASPQRSTRVLSVIVVYDRDVRESKVI